MEGGACALRTGKESPMQGRRQMSGWTLIIPRMHRGSLGIKTKVSSARRDKNTYKNAPPPIV